MATSYVPLRLRSNYSLLRGGSSIESVLERVADIGLRHLALTDENSLCGAVRFCRAAGRYGIKPIIGSIVSSAIEEAVLLVQNSAGYANLCELLSRRNLDDNFDLVRVLPELQQGLIALISDPDCAQRLAKNFDRKRLYLELIRPGKGFQYENQIISTAKRLSIGIVASTDVYFARPDELQVYKVLLAMREQTLLGEVKHHSSVRSSGYIRSVDEIGRLFYDCPELLTRTLELAESIEFDLLKRDPVMPGIADAHDPVQQLREKTYQRARNRYSWLSDKARTRINYELDLICRFGFASYFLVVADIVDYARRLGTPTAGRGSGASSIVAYCLGITNVDPLRYELPFERFLNTGRTDFPDLDIDFCWRLRDKVIEYVYRKYGAEHVAMVSTHATLQPRSAFREVAKTFGLSEPTITAIRKQLARGLDRNKWHRLPVEEETLEQIIKLAEQVIGFPHHFSVHCGGVVITPDPIYRHAPLQLAHKGIVVTQYNKDDIETIGLVKLDLLGNRALSTITEAVDIVTRTTAQVLDPEHFPDKDSETFALIRSGDTLGCNQLESPAMRHLLQMLKPSDTYGIMKALALIRPGPASEGMKELFVRRNGGLEKLPRLDPGLEKVLKDTYGILLYEDDAMLVAKCLAGLSIEEADRFRRAITRWRTQDQLQRVTEYFIRRCAGHGTDPELAREMCKQMAKFSSYSFCRAHAASYAMLAYAVAYLKAHYPAQFWVAALNNNAGMYEKRVYIEAAKRNGMKILLPCVNRSETEFALEGSAIRVGLMRLAELSRKSIDIIIKARRTEPYDDLCDFQARTGIGPRKTENLIRCGAFDFTGMTRPLLLWQLYTQKSAARYSSRLDFNAEDAASMPVLGDYTEEKKFQDEWQLLGLSARKHPMEYLKQTLSSNGHIGNADIQFHVGKRVSVIGIMAAARVTRTAKGDTMGFITLEDSTGICEVSLFPSVYSRLRKQITGLGPYIITGKVKNQYGSVSISAEHLINKSDIRVLFIHDLPGSST